MKFGPVAVADAEGAVLAHSTAAGDLRLRKAHRLTADDISRLTASGVGDVIVARLEDGDIGEDEAATRIALACQSAEVVAKPPSTGRVNLHAACAGLLRVDAERIARLNLIDPSITLATLPDHADVEAGQMVATVKIIPFAVPDALIRKAIELAGEGAALQLRPYVALSVGLVQTTLPSIKPSVLDKTASVTASRLARSGGRIAQERRVAHRTGELAPEIASLSSQTDMVIVFGASAMSDPDDVVPAAIRAAGGSVERVGMPVDPGNLLVLGRLDGKPVIGAPGCARSPKLNGFDWVLQRLAAGIDVSSGDIAAMGVGGLLMEIPTRPQPREPSATKPPRIAALLLAAGKSSRMGGPNKLLAEFDGVPLLRRTAERVLAARVSCTTVVLGNQAERMRHLLDGLSLDTVENQAFASGLASSLKCGIQSIGDEVDGILIVLADMPDVATADLNRLISTFQRLGGRAVVRASAGDVRGNPVILPRSLLARINELEGDTGARHLVETGGVEVVDIDIGQAARTDVDTPEALAAAGGVLRD